MYWMFVFPQNLYFEALTYSEAKFGDGFLEWDPDLKGLVFLSEEAPESSLFLSMCLYQGKTIWGHREKAAVYNPLREPSLEI